MALDAQSNWNVEMSQPLRNGAQKVNPNHPYLPTPPLTSPASSFTILSKPNAKEVHLPIEIILHILSYIPRLKNTQSTFWSCCLISRAWYSAAIPFLYERPYIGGGNFQEFVATVCPSKNAHIRKAPLAELVLRLDMSGLVHDGSKSLTARLLGRLKGNLEAFVAPQASFAINSFAALSKCTNLRYLDLQLISASISMKILFQTLRQMDRLHTLFLPRSSSHSQEHEAFSWPPELKALHLAGGVDDFFLRRHVTNVPACLDTLSIQSCPMVYTSALQETLAIVGPQLKNLTILHPMNRLQQGVLDHTLSWCNNLVKLRISADYITNFFFDPSSIPKGHPLQILDLECSATAGPEVGIDADEVRLVSPVRGVITNPPQIYSAIDEDCLPDLRSVRVSSRLAWTATKTVIQNAQDLAELLEEQERERPLGVDYAGVIQV
jgi:hypothetical protein